MAKESLNEKINPLKKFYKLFETEIVVFIFVVLRFFFKNITEPVRYFRTGHITFGSTEKNIIIGFIIVFIISFILAIITGSMMKKYDDDERKPLILAIAFFYACPASLPYIYSIDSVEGFKLLLPFLLFITAVFVIDIKYVKWITPIICFVFFYNAESFSDSTTTLYESFNKYGLIYFPAILMLILTGCFGFEEINDTVKKKKQTSGKINVENIALLSSSAVAGIVSFLLFNLKSDTTNQADAIEYLMFGRTVGFSLIVCIPAVILLGYIWYKSFKNGFSPVIPASILVITLIILFIVNAKKQNEILVPMFLISQFTAIYGLLKKKSSAVFNALADVEDFFSDKIAILLIILMVMASFSNVTSEYISTWFQRFMSYVPF